jgi:ankyrin repeat protein
MSAQPLPSTHNYKAFISYSHRADHALSKAIQQALHSFARPYFARRAIHVFRDQTDLSASHSLPDLIKKSLADSEYFILLASPRAADSEWVKREIDEWLSIHNEATDKILIVWTDGELQWDSQSGDFNWSATSALPHTLNWDHNNATPRSLRGRFSEPFYQDFRSFRSKPEDELSLRDPQFLDAIATVAATLHGMTKSDMVSADVEQHNRYKRVRRRVLTALITLALLTTTVAVYADNRRGVAEQRRIDAEKAIASERTAIKERDEASEQRDEVSKQRDAESKKRQEETKLKEDALNDKQEALNQKQEALDREKTALEKAESERREAESKGMEVDHTKLLATLSNDETSLPAPTNLSRMDLINTAVGSAGKLLSQAHKLAADTGDGRFETAAAGYQQTEEELMRRASCLPPQTARATLFGPDEKRLWAGFSASGKKFGVVYTDRMEIYETNNYSQNPRVLRIDQVPSRTPAEIVRAVADPSRERLLLEVKYQNYARQTAAAEVKGTDGDFYKRSFEEDKEPVRGHEREILSWNLDETWPTSEGFRTRLKETPKTDATGDVDCGREYLPVDGEMSLARAVSAPNKFGKFIKEKLELADSKKTPSSVLPIAHSADGTQGLYMVQAIINIDRDDDPIYHIFPALSDGKTVLRLEDGVIWAKEGELLCDGETGRFPATAVKPNYAPAALDAAHGVVVLRGLLLRIKGDQVASSARINLDWDGVRQVGITDDGSAVIVYFKDGGIELYGVEDAKLRHRFLPVADAYVTTVTPDGKHLILLREDGRIESWQLDVFGSNGWAAEQCPFKTLGQRGSGQAARTGANREDEEVSAAAAAEKISRIELYEEALEECDPILLRGLLAAGLDPNTKAFGGQPLLMKATACKEAAVAELLFSFGADVNARNRNGETMVMAAAYAGNLEAVQMLLSKGADVNITDPNGDTALSKAVSSSDPYINGRICHANIATALIAKGASTNIILPGGKTLLMAAAETGAECTRIFLNRGDVDVNARDKEGRSSLYYAAQKGDVDALKALLAAGANLDVRTAEGVTPLMAAASGYDETELSALRLLLDKGVDVNAKDTYGNTALIGAAWAEMLRAVEILLTTEVRVDEQDNRGETALMRAAERGNAEIVQALLRKGASRSIKNHEGKTAAMIAEEKGHEEVARLLRATPRR